MKKRLGFILGTFFFELLFPLFGQTINMPEMPSSPSMPEVTVPVLGTGYYHPEIPQYPSPKNSKKDNVENKNSKNESENAVKKAQSQTELISELIGNNDILTAGNLSGLSNAGLISDFSSLYGLSGISGSDARLDKIIDTLESIQKKQGNNIQETTSGKENKSRILRFKINGYDILDSITEVFISDIDTDGSFLLSGDRQYFADRKIRNETFYCLFKHNTQKTGAAYSIETDLMQDDTNVNSFLYKMAKCDGLTATKTGNLVVLKNINDDIKIELLLDLKTE